MPGCEDSQQTINQWPGGAVQDGKSRECASVPKLSWTFTVQHAS